MKRCDKIVVGFLLVGAVCGALAGNWLLAGFDTAMAAALLMLEG